MALEDPAGRDVPGEVLVFRLFLALAIVTAVALLWMAQEVQPQFRTRIYVALVGDLMAPVIAWRLLKAIGRRRARKGLEAEHADRPSDQPPGPSG